MRGFVLAVRDVSDAFGVGVVDRGKRVSTERRTRAEEMEERVRIFRGSGERKHWVGSSAAPNFDGERKRTGENCSV